MGKSEAVSRSATKEQVRIAQITQDVHDEDRSRIQKMLKEIIETTRCTQSQAEIALIDADYNVEVAVNELLENTTPETWVHQKSRKTKKQNGIDEHENFKRAMKRQNRATRNLSANNYNGKNNREFQYHERRDGQDGRDGRLPVHRQGRRSFLDKARAPLQPTADNKLSEKAIDEGDDLWKNSSTPLVFNRRETTLEQQPAKEITPVEPVAHASKGCAAGPMSFAAVVARPAKKDIPKPLPQVDNPIKPDIVPTVVELPKKVAIEQNLEKKVTLHDSFANERQSEDLGSSRVKISQSGTPMSFVNSADSVDQSLTNQLKNDLGLGVPSTHSLHSSISPQKKANELPHQRSHRSGVVEFVSGEAPGPASDYQFVFSFEGTPANISEHDSSFNEPQRNVEVKPEANHMAPVVDNSHGTAVLNQYQQQSSFRQNQINHYNRSRNNNLANSNLSFCDPNTVSYQSHSDLRQQNGAPQSPTKTHSIQQQHVSGPVSQPHQPHQQQSHQPQPQQHMFPPAQLPYSNFPYVNVYSPVTPAGIRDDYTASLLQLQQFTLGQMDANSPVMPQMAVTSAAPLPGVQNHHQSHQGQQQTNQRDHYSEMGKFQNNQINPPTQNSGSNGQSSRPASNINQSQQRQPIMDNGNQAPISGTAVPPPPGFSAPPTNIAAAPFIPQANLSSLFQSFQMPGYPHLSFPFMVSGNAQHKMPVYPQQTVDESMNLLGAKQKYGGHHTWNS